MPPPDRRPWWRTAVVQSSTLQPQTKLVLLVTLEDMAATGKVRPDRAKVARALGIGNVQRVNDRWLEAVKAGYLVVVHKAAWGKPAEYQAVKPDRPTGLKLRSVPSTPTGLKTRSVGQTPTDLVTGVSREPENQVSTKPPYRPETQDSKADYRPETQAASIEVTSRVGSDRKGSNEGDESPCPHGVPNGDQPDPFVNGHLSCPLCRSKELSA